MAKKNETYEGKPKKETALKQARRKGLIIVNWFSLNPKQKKTVSKNPELFLVLTYDMEPMSSEDIEDEMR